GFVFFFSSSRRHTIFYRDWSSDVCSSDLKLLRTCLGGSLALIQLFFEFRESLVQGISRSPPVLGGDSNRLSQEFTSLFVQYQRKIGRASLRVSVAITETVVSWRVVTVSIP